MNDTAISTFNIELRRRIDRVNRCGKRVMFLDVLRYFVCNYRLHADSIANLHMLWRGHKNAILANETYFRTAPLSEKVTLANFKALVCDSEESDSNNSFEVPPSTFLMVQFADVLTLRCRRASGGE